MVIDGQIDFVVDLPAPSIVVHGAHVDVPTVSQVHLRVQEPLLSLEHIYSLED